MPNLTASVPHQLSRAEAKRRIEDGVKDLHRQQGTVLAGLRETWHDDAMDFSGLVLGQSISGRLSVEDRAVHVEVALPWLLSVAAAVLKPRIEQQGRKMLDGPKSP